MKDIEIFIIIFIYVQDKDVAQASMNAIGDVSNLMLGKMEAARRRRRRREAIGNGTDPGGDDDDDDVEDVDQSMTISAASVAVQMQNIDPDAEGLSIIQSV